MTPMNGTREMIPLLHLFHSFSFQLIPSIVSYNWLLGRCTMIRSTSTSTILLICFVLSAVSQSIRFFFQKTKQQQQRSIQDGKLSDYANFLLEPIRSLVGVQVNDPFRLLLPVKHVGDSARRISIPSAFDSRTNWSFCPTIAQVSTQGKCASCWVNQLIKLIEFQFN